MLDRLRKVKRISAISNSIYKDYKEFKKTGKTPDRSVYSMRELFILTNSKSNDFFSKMVRQPIYRNEQYPGIFQDMTKDDIADFLKHMRQDGFYVFKQSLSPELVERLYQYSLRTPSKVLEPQADGDIHYSKEKKVIDLQHPISPRYQFDNDDIISSPDIQSIIFDESIINLAQLYLQTLPYFDILAMWWSLPFNGVGKSEAAQMYHFDLDRMKFVKFFFYLTDVDPETGPHCYVKNTHHGVPASICKDGRIEDAEIEQAVGKSQMVEICGKKGSIIAVDTRGLHKGKELTKGHRLLLQTQFSDSLFGANYPDFDLNKISDKSRQVIAKYKEVFNKFKSK